MPVRWGWLLFAAASVLAPLRAGASQTGIVINLNSNIQSCEGEAAFHYTAYKALFRFPTVRKSFTEKPCGATVEFALDDGCHVVGGHSITLAQLAPGAERSEHRTRQQQRNFSRAVLS